MSFLVFPPYHLIDYPHIALDDLDDFGADVFIGVVRDGDAVEAVTAESNGGVDCLEEALFVYAGDDEAPFVDGFGPFGGCADADGRERVSYAGEERALLRECTAVTHYSEGVHLEAVVVMESERFVLYDTGIELKAACCEPVTAAGMA